MNDIDHLSNKQLHYLANSNCRINLSEGAVRSGKTVSSNLRWIEYVLNSGPEGPYLMFGKTERTLKRNILTPLQGLLGDALRINQGQGEVKLGDKTIYLAGASDERAAQKIQGLTLAGALGDELSLAPESFFQMLLSRLSVDGAKFFGTTNPEGPYHWLKTNYIDRRDQLDMSLHHFTLNDNDSLSHSYIQSLKKEYVGVFYDRFILGKWVMAEGAIFDGFDEQIHVDKVLDPDTFQNYIVGVDYGTNNPCTFGLYGFDKIPPVYLIKEYFFDGGADNTKQRTDTQYANDMKKFIGDKRIDAIYVDPAALSFVVELRQRGLWRVNSAKNDVLPGIKFVSKMLASGHYFIDRKCLETIKGYQSYVWDARAQQTGIDKPLKLNDHTCFVADTMISTDIGNTPIQNIKIGDIVRTSNGYKPVIDAFSRTAIVKTYTLNDVRFTATPDHPIRTENRGNVPISQLKTDDKLIWLKRPIPKTPTSTPNSLLRFIDAGLYKVFKILQYFKDRRLREEKVYNITVEEDHEYFANGLLVSNCDRDRYALFSHFFQRDVPIKQKYYK